MKVAFFPAVMALAVALFVAGCGDSNPEATFDPLAPAEEGGGHASGWLPARHANEAREDPQGCAECHGVSFGGGISGVACTSCHLGSETEVHPLDWGDLGYARHDDFVEENGDFSCSVESCHGSDLDGVTGSGPSCVSSCHLGGPAAAHPLGWPPFDYVRHVAFVREEGTSSCQNRACHGAGDAETPPLFGAEEGGPACSECHLGDVFSGGEWTFSFHPVEWEEDPEAHGDFVASNGSTSCRNGACHGVDLGGVLSSGPACTVCHISFFPP